MYNELVNIEESVSDVEHKKFDEFCYYEVAVKYNNKNYFLVLNVGKGFYFGTK